MMRDRHGGDLSRTQARNDMCSFTLMRDSLYSFPWLSKLQPIPSFKLSQIKVKMQITSLIILNKIETVVE